MTIICQMISVSTV